MNHVAWLDMHLSKRKGEAKRKLQKGHAFAEKEFVKQIWLPAFGHLEHLYPEYEVVEKQ